jgi:hypothetical protein
MRFRVGKSCPPRSTGELIVVGCRRGDWNCSVWLQDRNRSERGEAFVGLGIRCIYAAVTAFPSSKTRLKPAQTTAAFVRASSAGHGYAVTHVSIKSPNCCA